MAFAKDLRASVLQAAMQGKLTEQLETDTPVSELLADISTKTKKKIMGSLSNLLGNFAGTTKQNI